MTCTARHSPSRPSARYNPNPSPNPNPNPDPDPDPSPNPNPNPNQVRQVVDGERLVSEFEVQAGAVPFVSDFVPLAYSGGLPPTTNPNP